MHCLIIYIVLEIPYFTSAPRAFEHPVGPEVPRNLTVVSNMLRSVEQYTTYSVRQSSTQPLNPLVRLTVEKVHAGGEDPVENQRVIIVTYLQPLVPLFLFFISLIPVTL